MNRYDVGIITDSILGCNMAFNLSANGYSAVLYNTSLESMQRNDINTFVSEIQEMGILASTSSEMTVNLLKSPKVVFIVSSNGVFAEDILKELYTLMAAGDIIIDTCDANYRTTAAKCRQFAQKEIGYIGAGFSGGSDGALSGMSLMAGGSFDAYNSVYEMLCLISSKYDGYPCCAYMGPDGAGQYVKMIHNGIELGIMQSMAEMVNVLQKTTGCGKSELADIINEWSSGDNESYLIQVLYDILNKRDAETGEYIFDIVSDRASIDKSVVWLCQGAAELSVPVPTIRAALDAGFISTASNEKNIGSGLRNAPEKDMHIINDTKKEFIDDVGYALYLCSICVYEQAFALLKRASDVYIWGTDLLDAAITFQGGSFIRARLLSRIIDACRSSEDITSLFEAEYFSDTVKKNAGSLRRVVSIAADAGICVPAAMASLSYIDMYALGSPGTGISELMSDYVYGTGFEIKGKERKRFSADWHSVREEISIMELRK